MGFRLALDRPFVKTTEGNELEEDISTDSMLRKLFIKYINYISLILLLRIIITSSIWREEN